MEYLKNAQLPTLLGVAPLGLPLPLFVLYVLSNFMSLALLLLSLPDLGYLSLWLIPPLSILTLISHAAIPLLARMPRTEGTSSYFSTLVVCVYILAIAWFVAFVAALAVAAMNERWRWNLGAVEDSGGTATKGTQVAQIVLSCLEVGILVTFAVKAHRQVISTGEPESWRPPIPGEDKTIVGPSTVMFDSGEGNHGDSDMKQISLASAEK